MKEKTIYLGDKVIISDPCYGLNTWCQGVLENVKEGEYITSYTRIKDDETRIGSISVVCKENIDDKLYYDAEKFTVGVDSGQAGIFDYDYYTKHHTDTNDREHVDDCWYDRACDLTEGYTENLSYVPFTEKSEFKACIMGLFSELNEIKEQYPELDTDSVYKGIINHYEELNKPFSMSDLKLDGLLDTLRNLKDVLSKDYVPPVKSESEKALDDVKLKWEMNLHNEWNKYKKTQESQEKIYTSMANTIDAAGYVSSSGYGDGSYTCYTAKDNDGRIIAIKIDFEYEDWDEEDE
jgi:hypothetical protein